MLASHDRNLSVSETETAELTIIRTVQGVRFAEDIALLALEQKTDAPRQALKSSNIFRLNPYVDENGVRDHRQIGSVIYNKFGC